MTNRMQQPWFALAIVVVLAAGAFVLLRRIGRDSRLRIAVMHSLAMIADGQTFYHRRHGIYATTLDVIPDSGTTVTITHADSSGWTAEAMHPAILRINHCYIYGGTIAHDPRLREPNEPVCW